MSFTSAGVSFGQACLMSAATPASCGAAAEVPLMAAQPSVVRGLVAVRMNAAGELHVDLIARLPSAA